MARTTPATAALSRTGKPFTLHAYDYEPGDERVGLQAARALGEDPCRVLKTLMTRVDGQPICVVLPSDREVSMKALARVMGGRAAEMMKPADAERLTGFKVGGISPFGQKRACPVVLEAAAIEQPHVFLNGGARGLQIRMAPVDLDEALGARLAEVVA